MTNKCAARVGLLSLVATYPPTPVMVALNPADPLSRETCFQSSWQAVLEAERRRSMWAQAAGGQYNGLAEMPPPPRGISVTLPEGGVDGMKRTDARGKCAVRGTWNCPDFCCA